MLQRIVPVVPTLRGLAAFLSEHRQNIVVIIDVPLPITHRARKAMEIIKATRA